MILIRVLRGPRSLELVVCYFVLPLVSCFVLPIYLIVLERMILSQVRHVRFILYCYNGVSY